MEGICGANCDECDLLNSNKCKGCKKNKGCPFGKKCFIANYIDIGGKERFNELKKILINEINSLNVEGMSKVEELYPLNGSVVNLEYILPNGNKTKLLDDNDIYLGSQIVNEEINQCFGIVANMNFILICEYEENEKNPEIIIFRRR